MAINCNEILDDKVELQKAIGYLRILSASDNEHMAYYDVAIAALLKNIPSFVEELPWTVSKCPCCGERLGEDLEDGYVKNYDYMKLCSSCGQLLKWKSNCFDDEEEE